MTRAPYLALALLAAGCGSSHAAASTVPTARIEREMATRIAAQDTTLHVDGVHCARTSASHASCVVSTSGSGGPEAVPVSVDIDNARGTYVWHTTG